MGIMCYFYSLVGLSFPRWEHINFSSNGGKFKNAEIVDTFVVVEFFFQERAKALLVIPLRRRNVIQERPRRARQKDKKNKTKERKIETTTKTGNKRQKPETQNTKRPKDDYSRWKAPPDR